MKRAMRFRHKVRVFLIGIIVFIPLFIFLHPEAASADTYYYKQTQDGTIHYTNINPKSNEYKSFESPWGALRTAPKVRRIKSKGKYPGNYDQHIRSTAGWYGVDPLLIKAMIKVESDFNPEAVSPKGAMGIMQLMPETARKNGVSDAFDPEENIEGGVRHFNKLMLMFNNRLTLALAGYNAGENAVIKYGYKIPPYPETIDYVEKVYKHYDNLRKKKVKRNIKSMVAERFDKKRPGKQKSGSFVYVETLETETVVSSKPGKKVSPQNPKIILQPKARTNETGASSTPVYGDAHTDNKKNSVIRKDGRYTVQIASFPDMRHAKEMESALKSKTYPVYVEKADIPGKGTWYRVRVGKFSTKEEAVQYGNDIKTSEPSVNSVYVALK